MSYPPKIDDFEREEPWKIWKLVFMSPNSRELIVGSQVPLSLQQFSLTKENLKMFYNLEGIQWRPWRRFDQFYEVFSLIIKKKERKKEKKKKKKKKPKTLSPWIDLVNLKVLFLRNSTELDFLCDCSNGVCLPNVLKNMFIMLFP